MIIKPTLIICEHSPARFETLKQSLGSAPGLELRRVPPDQVALQPDVDAVYMSVRAAEEFGALPVVHRAQILVVDHTKTSRQLPRWVVAGVAMAKEDPREPIFEIQLTISAIVRAVEELALHSKECPMRIAVWTGWLGFDHVNDISQAGRAIREAYEAPVI
jgi:hypothetical protein